MYILASMAEQYKDHIDTHRLTICSAAGNILLIINVFHPDLLLRFHITFRLFMLYADLHILVSMEL